MEKFFGSMKEGEEWFYSQFDKEKTFDATARTIASMGYARSTPLY